MRHMSSVRFTQANATFMRSRTPVLLRWSSRGAAQRRGASSSSSTTPLRVLCSLAELRALDGRALKFPLHLDQQQQTQTQDASVQPRDSSAPAARSRRARQHALATGFVFACEETGAPRAFVNSCPHARLELDLDDSDFFCAGFVQCKAHGAFFDPRATRSLSFVSERM